MKTPPDPTDPLLQSFADEAADLPLRGANEARITRARAMQHRRQFALTVTVLFCGVCAWQGFTPRDAGRETIAVQTIPAEPAPRPAHDSAPPSPAPIPTPSAPPEPEPREYVKVQTEEQAMNDPLPIPDGLSKEQRAVVVAARGLPLLLVRDSSGKVTRIHVIER